MTLLRLAFADLWHDRTVAFCNIAAIIGVVAPLAILAGIKAGVVEALITDLTSRPDILNVRVAGDHGFSADEIEEVRNWQETGFVVPSSRAIARRLLVRIERGGVIRRATLIATGPGEPFLPEETRVGYGEVAASEGLSRRLGLVPGMTLQAIARRGDAGETVLDLALEVKAVLPHGSLRGEAVLMTAELMEDIEAFYDGYALPHLGIGEGRPLDARTAMAESMRLYAADLGSVATLERKLEARFGIEVSSNAAEVVAILDLERRLGLALNLIVAAATLGLLAALVASFWGMTRSRRQSLAVLAMIGMPPVRLAFYPVWVAFITALAGLLGAALLVVAGAFIADGLFGGELPGNTSFLLPAADLIKGTVLVFGIAVVAAFVAAREASRTDPGTVFREA